MPAIYFIIKRFLERFQPIQKKLVEVQYSLEVEKLMRTLCTMPAEELKSRLASSGVKIESTNQFAEEFLANVNVLLEAEKTRKQLQQVTFEEIRKLNVAITNEIKKEAGKWH